MNDLNHAVATLRATLPDHCQSTPRLVRTTSETLDGIAFCTDHIGDTADECVRCEVIDTYSPQLAERIVALLRAAGPLAAHLNALDIRGHQTTGPNASDWACRVCEDLGQPQRECPGMSAAAIVREINTAVTR